MAVSLTTGFVHRDDPGMMKAGQGPGFAQESVQSPSCMCYSWTGQLQRDLAFQERIEGPVNYGVMAKTQYVQNLEPV